MEAVTLCVVKSLMDPVNRASMIISHKYRFIFVKTSKTAGTSIEVFLSDICGPHDILTPIYPIVESHAPRNYNGFFNPITELVKKRCRGARGTLKNFYAKRRFYNHMPAWLIRERIGHKIWAEYYKFCVERNPWDKTLSHYYMLRARNGGGLSLQEYFRKGCFCLNYPKYTDANGDVMVDRILKYESLNQELADLLGKLGIPFAGRLGVLAKQVKGTNKGCFWKQCPGTLGMTSLLCATMLYGN